MTSKARTLVLGTAAATVALAIVLWMHRDSLQITYHVHGLRLAQQDVSKPNSIPHYFTTRGVRWLLQRQRSSQERDASARLHREALLRLGYFERRQFSVNCELAGEADREFCRMRSRLPMSCTLWQNFIEPTQGSTKVTICVRATDMKLWEKLFAEFNEKR